ncbi:hypothetical protein GF366_02655 [Candidatus Peregrinibacteria bacterium]|nr:hypothetical protein [Candidatus Peregrinibacteria bacterium]
MNIKILGTRGEIKESKPYHSRHSGVFIDNQLLFDLGEKEFLKYNPKYIFITHLHPDHAFFVRDGEIPKKTKIFAPEKLKGFDINKFTGTKKINSYKITAIPTIHSKKVKSQTYLVEKDKKILYTGDMIWIKKKYHPKLKNLDLVIMEGSFIKKGGMIRRDKEGNIYGHQGIPNLINLFEKFTDKIIITHLGSWFYKSAKKSRKKVKKIPKTAEVKIAYDGMRLKI